MSYTSRHISRESVPKKTCLSVLTSELSPAVNFCLDNQNKGRLNRLFLDWRTHYFNTTTSNTSSGLQFLCMPGCFNIKLYCSLSFCVSVCVFLPPAGVMKMLNHSFRVGWGVDYNVLGDDLKWTKLNRAGNHILVYPISQNERAPQSVTRSTTRHTTPCKKYGNYAFV